MLLDSPPGHVVRLASPQRAAAAAAAADDRQATWRVEETARSGVSGASGKGRASRCRQTPDPISVPEVLIEKKKKKLALVV